MGMPGFSAEHVDQCIATALDGYPGPSAAQKRAAWEAVRTAAMCQTPLPPLERLGVPARRPSVLRAAALRLAAVFLDEGPYQRALAQRDSAWRATNPRSFHLLPVPLVV